MSISHRMYRYCVAVLPCCYYVAGCCIAAGCCSTAVVLLCSTPQNSQERSCTPLAWPHHLEAPFASRLVLAGLRSHCRVLELAPTTAGPQSLPSPCHSPSVCKQDRPGRLANRSTVRSTLRSCNRQYSSRHNTRTPLVTIENTE